MKKGTGYTEAPFSMVDLKVIEDFLPPPHKLVPKEEKVKVTIDLSQSSLEFFKKHAKKQKVPYQKMIRAVLDRYVQALQ